MPNFLIFNHLHPIVISEICSFSSKNSGKNLLKSSTKKFVLENSHKNKQIFAEKNYPDSLQVKFYIKTSWIYDAGRDAVENKRFFINNYDNLNVNIKTIHGETALHYAVVNKQPEVVKLLLKIDNINFNSQGNDDETVLHYATYKGYTEIVKLLLDTNNINDIDVNIQDVDGGTALHVASSKGYTDIVKLLIDRDNIDVNLQDNDGHTALWFASYRKHGEIVELLENHIKNKK